MGAWSLRALGVAALVAATCCTGSALVGTQGPASGTRATPATGARLPDTCPTVQPPQFAPSARSNRNLALVRLRGGNHTVVRDITDITHPRTIATLDVPSQEPRFVNATEVSWIWGDQWSNLFRSPFAPHSGVQVAACALLFDWSANGTSAVYVGGSGLHAVSGGHDRVIASLPPFPMTGCESQSCADNWQFKLAYSPDGSMISVVESYGLTGFFRIWTADGRPLANLDSTLQRTMSVWSGSNLYFRDANGVEVWHGGATSPVLPGVAWIAPVASSAGGQILFTVRDGSGLPHVNILDTTSGKARELASSRDFGVFLTPRYVWYQGIRLCMPSDQCPLAPIVPTGKTYIRDMVDGTESESIITYVSDVWPHPA